MSHLIRVFRILSFLLSGFTSLGEKVGEYSRLFIPTPQQSNQSNSNQKTTGKNEVIPQQIYLLFFNPCSVPFSYIVFTTDGKQRQNVTSRYTATKNDSFIPTIMNKRDKTLTGGLHLLVENQDRIEDLLVTLVYKTISGESVLLIRETFNSQIGRICPMNKCQALHNYASQRCMLKWIDFDDVIRTVRFDVTYLPCDKPVLAKVVIKVIGIDTKLFFTDHLSLTVDAMDKIGVRTKPLQIGFYPLERQDQPGDGSYTLDTGSVSLYVRELADISHLMV